MVLGLIQRVSWICLLLFSSGACFPATKGEYKYPYTRAWRSAGGSAPGSSNLQSGGSHAPLVSLQHDQPSGLQQPAVSGQQGVSPTGNQSPSSLGAPSGMGNRFLVRYDSVGSAAPSSHSGVGYVSPPVGTGKTPSFSVQRQPPVQRLQRHPPVQRQPAVGSTGTSNAGSYWPIYEAPSSGSGYPAGNTGAAGSVAFRDPFSDSSLSWENMPEGAFASPSASVDYNPSAWMPSSFFQGLMPQGGDEETSPPVPSSYIIQTRDGYQRARQAYSHMAYSPEYVPPITVYRRTPETGVSGKGTGVSQPGADVSGKGADVSGPGAGIKAGRKV